MALANNFGDELFGLDQVLSPKQLRKLERQAKRTHKQNVYSAASTSLKQATNQNVSPLPNVPKRQPLVAKNQKQKDLIRSIIECDQTITIGSAGTGKTYVSAAMAADMLMRREITKIIITRPNVPTGRSLGFFPGTLEDKMGPWLAPITNVLKQRLGDAVYECQVKLGNIEIVPFEVIRGRSFDNCFVLLDEAQNTTIEEMKAFLTRIGSDSKVVINGDIRQSDIEDKCGLAMVLNMVEKYTSLSNKTNIVEFTIDDVVRSDIVADWLRVFEKEHL